MSVSLSEITKDKYIVYKKVRSDEIIPQNCKFYKEFDRFFIASLYARHCEDYEFDLEVSKRKLQKDQHEKVYSDIFDLMSKTGYQLEIEEVFDEYFKKEKKA